MIDFTHLWVSGFGWENTIFQSEDFKVVELLGKNKKDGDIFLVEQNNGVTRILKGFYN